MCKACFIIPYFGKFPVSFNIFLKTCGTNSDFDWLIITDDRTPYPYPGNVHVKHMEFSDFVNRVQSCFDFPISLYRAYKICDFRAAFGEIFAEELHDYLFWGHCDTDQYFGSISSFITDDILSSYDKILCLGHFTLFRNVPHINQMYRIKDNTYDQDYQDVFSFQGHWIFDEWPTVPRTSINRIFKQEKVKTYCNASCFCDLIPFKSCFRRTLFDYHTETWTPDSVKNEVYVWQNGELMRYWLENGILRYEPILYVHIRQRKMNVSEYCTSKNCFLIKPNKFISFDQIDDNVIKKQLTQTNQRRLFHPDEIGRKLHSVSSFLRLVYRRILRILN